MGYLHTDFSHFWPDRERYLGTNERGQQAVEKLHFPGLDPGAAVWLAEQRRIRAVGLDTASIDHGRSKTFDTHRALFEREIPAFENLTNLENVPTTGATVVALPMKIRGGSGGPLHAIAIVPAASGLPKSPRRRVLRLFGHRSELEKRDFFDLRSCAPPDREL